MPWEETGKLVRSGHRKPDEFQKETLRTLVLSEEDGIEAVIGKLNGKDSYEILSYLFEKDKGWTLEKAKDWFKQHQTTTVDERLFAFLPFGIQEKISEKPLRIRGVALTVGISRNLNVYTPEELQEFATKLVGAPMYIEHVTAANSVGRVTKTEWDGHRLLYEAEIYDQETADKIRKGLIQHVSVGADYETVDFLAGKVPHGLHNPEISLVAVPGVPEANIRVVEKLRKENVSDPLVAGEYVLGFQQDAQAFLPEHFSTVWLDRENGILAIMGKPRQQPDTLRTMAIFFDKRGMWNQTKIRDWLTVHPDYMVSASNDYPAQPFAYAERLFKKNFEPTMQVSEAIRLIESVLPSPLVQKSWSLGPQRMCQELRRVILKLEGKRLSESRSDRE